MDRRKIKEDLISYQINYKICYNEYGEKGNSSWSDVNITWMENVVYNMGYELISLSNAKGMQQNDPDLYEIIFRLF